jgi:site-specific DNA recombinase
MQVEDGFSLDAQLDRLRAYCASQGWTIAGVYTDEGQSAKTLERTALKQMIYDMTLRKIDVVLVYKLDRLTRSVVNLYELLQTFDRYTVAFRSATEVFDTTSATGRLFITVVAAMAQWERETIAERSREGQIQMTREGRWSGGNRPFGYHYREGQLTINDPEAAVVREIFQRYCSGQGIATILHWLNHPQRLQLAPNGHWRQWGLKYLLRNPLYAGYVRYGYRIKSVANQRYQGKPLIVRGQHAAIVEEATFSQAQALIKQKATTPRRDGTGKFPLTGVLYCGLCGARMTGFTWTRAKGGVNLRRYYVCVEAQHTRLCPMPLLRQEVVEGEVLAELAFQFEKFAALTSNRPLLDHGVQKKQQITALETQLRDVRKRSKRWMDAFESGHINSSELRQRLDGLKMREQEITLQWQTLQTEPSPTERNELKSILSSFHNTWESANIEEKKQLIHSVIDRIELRPGPKTGRIYSAQVTLTFKT